MKTLFFTGLCAVSVGMAGAQALRVNVRSDREMLPYAYVYVNGRAAAVTDSMGVALLQEGKVKAGDTLSASFVGTTPDFMVADGAMLNRGTCDLLLPEMYTITAEEVKVWGDVAALFRKSVRRPGCTDADLIGPFERVNDLQMLIALPGGRTYPVNGRLVETGSGIDSVNGGPRWLMGYRLSTRNVTEPVREMMDWHLTQERRVALALTWRVLEQEWWDRTKPKYGYLGKQKGCRVFRITYEEVEDTPIFCQMLVGLDIETGYPRWLEYRAVNARTNYQESGRVDYQVWKDRSKWLFNRHILVLADRKGHVEGVDRRVDMSMSNTRMVPPKGQKPLVNEKLW